MPIRRSSVGKPPCFEPIGGVAHQFVDTEGDSGQALVPGTLDIVECSWLVRLAFDGVDDLEVGARDRPFLWR
jgi:hypothetical protein